MCDKSNFFLIFFFLGGDSVGGGGGGGASGKNATQCLHQSNGVCVFMIDEEKRWSSISLRVSIFQINSYHSLRLGRIFHH